MYVMAVFLPLLRIGAFLLVAIAFFWAFKWPKRRGESQHCRKCDYQVVDLAEMPEPNCPECGSDLSSERAVVRGARTPKQWHFVAGCTSIVIALLLTASTYQDFVTSTKAMWFKSNETLFADIVSDSAIRADHARNEFRKRVRNDNTILREIRGFLLAQIGDDPINCNVTASEYQMYRYYARKNRLGTEADQAFARFLTPVHLEVPPVVCANEAATASFWIQLRVPRIYSGNFEVRRLFTPSDTTRASSSWRRIRNNFGSEVDIYLPVGEHELLGDITVTTELGSMRRDDPNARLIPHSLQKTARIAVVEADDYWSRALQDLKSVLTPNGFQRSHNKRLVTRWRFNQPSPIDADIQFAMVIGERLVPIGSDRLYRGRTHPLIVKTSLPKASLPAGNAEIRATIELTAKPDCVEFPEKISYEVVYTAVPRVSAEVWWINTR